MPKKEAKTAKAPDKLVTTKQRIQYTITARLSCSAEDDRDISDALEYLQRYGEAAVTDIQVID